MIFLSWLIVTAVVAGSILGGATSASPDYDVEDLVDYNAAEWAHIADVHPAEANSAGNKTDPGCILIPADLMHYYCGSQEFKVMNELLMEVVCNVSICTFYLVLLRTAVLLVVFLSPKSTRDGCIRGWHLTTERFRWLKCYVKLLCIIYY